MDAKAWSTLGMMVLACFVFISMHTPIWPLRRRRTAAALGLPILFGAFIAYNVGFSTKGISAAHSGPSSGTAMSEPSEPLLVIGEVAAKPRHRKPPQAYCAAIIQEDEVRREADKNFPNANSSNSDWLSRKEWLDARIEKIYAPVSEALKTPAHKWSSDAATNNWLRRCDAMAAGLTLVEDQDARQATHDDVNAARDAITLEYLWRLENAPDRFFNPERYSVASCRPVEVEGYKFLGCQMRSIRYETDWDIFLIARNERGTTLVPYNGEAEGRLRNKTALSDADVRQVQIGAYVGDLPIVNYAALRDELD